MEDNCLSEREFRKLPNKHFWYKNLKIEIKLKNDALAVLK